MNWQCGETASKRLLQHDQETNPYDTSDRQKGDEAVQPLISSKPEQAPSSLVPIFCHYGLFPFKPTSAFLPSSYCGQVCETRQPPVITPFLRASLSHSPFRGSHPQYVLLTEPQDPQVLPPPDIPAPHLGQEL